MLKISPTLINETFNVNGLHLVTQNYQNTADNLQIIAL